VTDRQQALADLDDIIDGYYARSDKYRRLVSFIESVPDPAETCDGSSECPATTHIEGCFNAPDVFEGPVGDTSQSVPAETERQADLALTNHRLLAINRRETEWRQQLERELAEARKALRDIAGFYAGCRDSGHDSATGDSPCAKRARAALSASEQPSPVAPLYGRKQYGPDRYGPVHGTPLTASQERTLREPEVSVQQDDGRAAREQGRPATSPSDGGSFPHSGSPSVLSPHVADRDPDAPSPHA
jgi:hypothetical protein